MYNRKQSPKKVFFSLWRKFYVHRERNINIVPYEYKRIVLYIHDAMVLFFVKDADTER